MPKGPRRLTIDPLIFLASLAAVLLIVVAALMNLPGVRALLLGLQDWVATYFAWLLSLTVSALLIFALWLALSRHGQVRLGPDDSRPEFGTLAWLSMLFSAGMGIGLVFFGVAEPMLHYLDPRSGDLGSPAAAREALRLSLFHWGLHAWSIYAVLGLALALVHFRLREPLAIRSTLFPILKSQTHRMPGKLIDCLAVLGTLFGLATSLGLGAMQVNAGLAHLLGMEQSPQLQSLIIVLITLAAIISLLTGLGRGIRRLSELNMGLAALLLLFLLLVGPTAILLRGLPDLLGHYLQGMIGMGLRTDPFRSLDWQKNWTLFYWAWWLSWAPFVGTFIARISRGRTIREFVLGVLLTPSLIALLWFGVFGAAALHETLAGNPGLAEAVQGDSAMAIFALLESYPWAGLTSTLAILLVTVFFITSSDSGSFVVDMLASGGNPNPPAWQRVFWASLEGLLAITLLLIGGLNALQAGAVSLGLPFALLMILVMLSLLRILRTDAGIDVNQKLSKQ